MKRTSLNFTATILIALLLSQFLPWWSVMISAFLTSVFLSLKKSAVFIVPFLAIALLWITQTYYLSLSNDFVLAKKIAILLPLKENPYLLMIVTGVIGGIAAGITGVFGKQCSLLLNKSS
jgi:predicted neutral ceramidase superfamily lipid hydrolase